MSLLLPPHISHITTHNHKVCGYECMCVWVHEISTAVADTWTQEFVASETEALDWLVQFYICNFFTCKVCVLQRKCLFFMQEPAVSCTS